MLPRVHPQNNEKRPSVRQKSSDATPTKARFRPSLPTFIKYSLLLFAMWFVLNVRLAASGVPDTITAVFALHRVFCINVSMITGIAIVYDLAPRLYKFRQQNGKSSKLWTWFVLLSRFVLGTAAVFGGIGLVLSVAILIFIAPLTTSNEAFQLAATVIYSAVTLSTAIGTFIGFVAAMVEIIFGEGECDF